MSTITQEKQCNKCGEIKSLTGFYTYKTLAYMSWCKTCLLAYNREYRAHRVQVDPEWKAKRNGESNLWHKTRYKNDPDYRAREAIRNRERWYGVTELQFQTLMLIQCGKCAICQEPFNPDNRISTAHVDHNHDTKEVRGLLCGHCNAMLGNAKDNLGNLQTAIDYLGGN